MKKVLSVICLLTILLTIFTLPVSATETTTNKQSLSIDAVAVAKLQTYLEPGDEVVYAYYRTDIQNFPEAETIEEVFTQKSIFTYVVQNKQSQEVKFLYPYYWDRDKFFFLDEVPQYYDARDINGELDATILEHIAPDVEVQSIDIILICSGFYTDIFAGKVVYIQTNKGGYVYYPPYYHKNGHHLFPVDAFMEFMKWRVEGFASELDLSVYDVNSPSFNLNAPLPGGRIIPTYIWIPVLLAVVLIPIGIHFYRKKRMLRRLIQESSTIQT